MKIPLTSSLVFKGEIREESRNPPRALLQPSLPCAKQDRQTEEGPQAQFSVTPGDRMRSPGVQNKMFIQEHKGHWLGSGSCKSSTAKLSNRGHWMGSRVTLIPLVLGQSGRAWGSWSPGPSSPSFSSLGSHPPMLYKMITIYVFCGARMLGAVRLLSLLRWGLCWLPCTGFGLGGMLSSVLRSLLWPWGPWKLSQVSSGLRGLGGPTVGHDALSWPGDAGLGSSSAARALRPGPEPHGWPWKWWY